FLIAVLIWFGGFMAVISRWAAAGFTAWSIARRGSRVADPAYLELLQDLSIKLGIRRNVQLVRSEDPGSPFTFGLFNSTVVLPFDCHSWDLERRRIVLTHELAHIKRRDCLVQAIAQVACGVYWINPMVWLSARKLRIESERACDDWVLADGVMASDYADHLVRIARSIKMASCPEPAALMIARPSQLQSRLESILDPKANRAKTAAPALAIAIVGLVALAPLAAIRPIVRAAGPVSENRQQGSNNGRTDAPISSNAAVNAPGNAQLTLDALAGIAPSQPADTRQQSEQPASSSPDPTAQGSSNGVATAQEREAAGAPSQSDSQEKETGKGQREPSATDKIAVQALTEALKDPDPQVREEAIHALLNTNLQVAALEPVINAALKDSNAQMREQGVWALGVRGGPGAAQRLAEALKDSDPQVRAKAAWGLGLQGDSASIGALISALKDSDGEVQAQAAWALGLKGDDRAIEPLVEALRTAHPQARAQAAWALGLKGNSRAVAGLIGALKDSEARVRSTAAWALGLKGDANCIPALKDALKDANQEVRRQAAWALGMRLMSAAGDGDNETEDERDGQLAPNPKARPRPQPRPAAPHF
ncbi:MAG TPA: HEAT repeat domain-containing protein, partial [Blastocatellia bacterium]|nr:HEAT repeat domain-containing protein [Blastocatellia bacterium]